MQNQNQLPCTFLLVLYIIFAPIISVFIIFLICLNFINYVIKPGWNGTEWNGMERNGMEYNIKYSIEVLEVWVSVRVGVMSHSCFYIPFHSVPGFPSTHRFTTFSDKDIVESYLYI